MVSIFTNLAAYSAQGNIGIANDATTSSISRLSSGQRIVKASDDVAGLSVGTVLATGVTTLKQALANAGQGSSLLQVADGALAQITQILARQKAVATQANSGTLSDTDRSYLNQEFQALTAQIDQITSATSFSSVRLLDGSLSGAVGVGTNTNLGTSTQTVAAQYAADQTVGNVITAVVNANLTAGDTITVNGVVVTLAAATAGVGTVESVGKVLIGATQTATQDNIVAFLNNNTDARLANWQFVNTGAGTIGAVWTGGKMSGAVTVDVTVNTTTASALVAGTAANRTTNAPGANNVDGLSYGKVVALGSVKGSIFASGTSAASGSGAAILLNDATNSIINNEAFIGKLGEGKMGKIEGSYTGVADTAVFTIKVGEITYSSTATAITAAGTTITFTGANALGNAAGGTFTMKTGTAQSFSGQAQLDVIIEQMNAAMEGITFAQNRDISSFINGGVASVGGIVVGTLQGASVNFRSDSFSNLFLDDFKIEAPTNGGTDAIFTAVINGETYISPAGQGNQIGTNTAIVLQSISDPTRAFSIVTGATTLPTSGSTNALDISSQDKADAIAQAIREAFGLTGESSAVNLQIGARSDDIVGVQIRNVSSSSLFENKKLNITTLPGAQEASAAVDVALSKITATRASVGALQSRLNFTAQNLQNSISNQDAARSVLLDTDVSSESTKYATSQVQMQAGIAVLAQANQITQQLLKLLQ